MTISSAGESKMNWCTGAIHTSGCMLMYISKKRRVWSEGQHRVGEKEGRGPDKCIKNESVPLCRFVSHFDRYNPKDMHFGGKGIQRGLLEG